MTDMELNCTSDSISLDTRVACIERSVDTWFVILAAILVFVMQPGFAVLTAGSVRSKNAKNALMKNILDIGVGLLAYYSFGYALAWGEGNRFIGGASKYALSKMGRGCGPKNEAKYECFHIFFFNWAYAAAVSPIISGSVAERTRFYAYLTIAFAMNAVVYPPVSRWVWHHNGFLRHLWNLPGRSDLYYGTVDFAGCIVVHLVGGFSGLVGAIAVGARQGRFKVDGSEPIYGHSAPLATIGTFLLWFAWYGFNLGSTFGISDGKWMVTERIVVATTLSGAAGSVTSTVLTKIIERTFNINKCLNGAIAGLVSITASCAFVEPYSALIIGAIGAMVYTIGVKLLEQLKIDDPLEAFPIHGMCGMWGAIAAGLFSRRDYMMLFDYDQRAYGLLYGGGWRVLVANIIGIGIVTAWTVAITAPIFYVLKLLHFLRISPEEEIVGNDVSKHGGPPYPEFKIEKDNAHGDEETYWDLDTEVE